MAALRHLFWVLVLACVLGCSPVRPERPPADLLSLPAGWQQALNNAESTTALALVNEALRANPELNSRLAELAAQAAELRLSGAQRLPQLDADLAFSRSRINSNVSTDYRNQAELALSLGWDLDIWGRLSAAQRQAAYSYAASRAQVRDSQVRLAEQVMNAWLAVQAADLKVALRVKRRANIQENLEIIASGYRLGLNNALDLYLARSDLATADSQLLAAQEARRDQVRALQTLLGRYPDGHWPVSQALANLLQAAPADTLSSRRLMQRADLNQAWLELAAADAAAASAYKSRFPQLQLSARLSDTSDKLSTVGEGSLGWSLLAGLSQPLLDAGRLKAREQGQRARAEQLTYRFQQALLSAAQEVSTGLSAEQSLTDQLVAVSRAVDDADAAQTLAFEQYQRGLVAYTTVLEAQRRATDARLQRIDIRLALQQNRIQLFRALAAPEPQLSASRS